MPRLPWRRPAGDGVTTRLGKYRTIA
jgi:hypothetical protein